MMKIILKSLRNQKKSWLSNINADEWLRQIRGSYEVNGVLLDNKSFFIRFLNDDDPLFEKRSRILQIFST